MKSYSQQIGLAFSALSVAMVAWAVVAFPRTNSKPLWVALRVLFVAMAAWGIASSPRTNSNLNWIACGLFSFATGIGLFFWLMAVRHYSAIDWSAPLSLTKPFLPMKRNPLHFWMVAAISLVLGGIALFMEEFSADGQHLAFGGTFFFVGVAIFCAILAAKKMATKR